ncbi:beta propeller repeat protein [Micromonospora siamensis]|uniref:Uncharacterized protein n=1 Tax=Micromonospora siamensis TaxID=299152 RepID=A0A1C5GW96_9ACTN|nr:hypothetical protein [Micromonospora siamensis]SCG38076.1 hypothetical protein GA0074704_0617 [Micromonospora siamensis]
MRETTVVERVFAEFEADALTSFRPPGVADAQRRLRQRRRRRGLLAGLTALLVGGPAGAFALAGGQTDPRPTPTPVVSVSPQRKFMERQIIVNGVPSTLTDIRFVDGRVGWALLGTCEPTADQVSGDCVRTLARTTDGGQSWRYASWSDATGPAQLLAVDADTAAVRSERVYRWTQDGGVTLVSLRLTDLPDVVRRSMATRSGLYIGCPGAKEPGAVPVTCTRSQVRRVGGGALPRQPALTLQPDNGGLFEGGDGRLWVVSTEGDGVAVATSDDQGESWLRLPTVAGPATLSVSPDGRGVWLLGEDRSRMVWRLVGDRWQQRGGLPDDTSQAAALDADTLVVTSAYGGLGFWTGGRYTDVPELREPLRRDRDDQDAGVDVLPDGTIAVRQSSALILGTGRGTDRTWVRIS